jgi:hypothetical protein
MPYSTPVEASITGPVIGLIPVAGFAKLWSTLSLLAAGAIPHIPAAAMNAAQPSHIVLAECAMMSLLDVCFGMAKCAPD